MAACMRNMTFTSSSLAKWASLKSKYGQKQMFFILPKRHLSVVTSQQQPQQHHGNNRKCCTHKLYRHNIQWGTLLGARYASTDHSANIPQGYIPDNPLAPTEEISDVLPKLNALGEPTLGSIGLGGNSPSGLVQQYMEMVHVSLDLPWWGAILICSLTIRTLVFPAMLYQRKNTIRIKNHMPTITRLTSKVKDAKDVGNQEMFMKRQQEMTEYMKRNKLSYHAMLVMPLLQIPIFLSVYQAIRKMSLLPLESMKTGGIFWFTDLTVPDPTYLIPAVASLTILAMLELGAEAQSTKDMGHIVKWCLRGMPVVAFFCMTKCASGIALYWTMNNFISLITVLILKQERVKHIFKIPDEIVHKKDVKAKKGFFEGFQEAYNTSQVASDLNRRRQLDDITFRSAGTGPVPKTYSYDPTKKKVQTLKERIASK